MPRAKSSPTEAAPPPTVYPSPAPIPSPAPAAIPRAKQITTLARKVLATNDRGTHTIPCDRLYPADWLWDAGFNSLGWATAKMSRAFDELDTIVTGQWEDGMLPHIVFLAEDPSYFPSPTDWGTTHTPPTSGITQPPILASALWRLVDRGRDSDTTLTRARALWPALVANHDWWHSARDPHGTGLVAIYHPWESGTDNSPAFDEPLAAVSTDALPPYHRRDLAVVDASQRPTDVDYDRYWALVVAGRAIRWDPVQMYDNHPFAVADPLVNAVLLRADRDLAALGRLLGYNDVAARLDGYADRSSAGLEHLFDPQVDHYRALDLRTGSLVGPATIASLVTPWSGAVPKYRLPHLAAAACRWADAAGCMVPTVDPSAPSFEPDRYWAGAVWMNTNWLVGHGFAEHGFTALGERIRRESLALVAEHGCVEYFNPRTRAPHGGTCFSWTAALALDWLAN